MKRLIQAQVLADDLHKVVYIPNWADPSIIYPIEHVENPFIKQLGIEDKFLIQYSGNMGLAHDMETIIEAARSLCAYESVKFLLIGGGGKLEMIKEMILRYKLQNIVLLPHQPRENLKNSLCASHISLISLEKRAQGVSVPSKLYGIMASGRPIIAIVPQDSEVAMTVKEYNCGIITPPKDVTALVKAIVWLKTHKEERTIMGEKAYKAFLNKFTVQRCADQYYSLIRSTLK